MARAMFVLSLSPGCGRHTAQPATRKGRAPRARRGRSDLPLSRGVGPGSIEDGAAFEEFFARDLATRVALFRKARSRSPGIGSGGRSPPRQEHDERDHPDPERDPMNPTIGAPNHPRGTRSTVVTALPAG